MPAIPARPDVILLGPRGSGKTTVGRRVAQLLETPFVDLDQVVQHAAGRSIREIFASEGEAGFRAHESAALAAAASKPGVLATGGGIVTVEANRRLLKSVECPRILLLASPEILYARIAADPATAEQRPALTRHSGIDELRHLLDQRMPWYEEVATVTIDAASGDSEEIALRIAGCARSG